MSFFWSHSQGVSTTSIGLGNYGNQGVVTVKNTGTNTVLLGQINVNSSDRTIYNGYPLQPGESVVLPPGASDLGSLDPNVVMAATESGTSSIAWFGVFNNDSSL